MTLPWYYAPLYCAVAALAVSAWLRDRDAAAASTVLIGNWLTCTTLALVTGSQDVWWALCLVDMTSGVAALLLDRRGLTTSYGVEILSHIAYRLSDHAGYYHWWSLFWIGCGQAVLVLVEGDDGGYRSWHGSRSGDVSRVRYTDVACSREGVAEKEGVDA